MADRAIARRIKVLRKQNNLTQKDVAMELNIDVSTLSKYERGTRKLPNDHIPRLAETYRTTVEDILNGKTPVQTTRTYAHPLKQPYRPPRTLFSYGLLFTLIILMTLYVVTADISLAAGGLTVLAIYGLYHAYHFFIHDEDRQAIILASHKEVTYTHPAKQKARLQFKMKLIFNMSMLMLALFLLYGILLSTPSSDLSAGEETFLASLFIVTFVLLTGIFITLLLSTDFKKHYEEAQLNLRMNTYRFLIVKILSYVHYFILATYLAPVIHGDGLIENRMLVFAFLLMFLSIPAYSHMLYEKACDFKNAYELTDKK